MAAVRAGIGHGRVTVVASGALTCGLLMVPTMVAAGPPAHGGQHAPRLAWDATWTADSTKAASDATGCPAHSGVTDATVRDVVPLSIGGDRIRVRLTNVFGERALHIGHAAVALSGTGAATVPHTNRRLTFHGRNSVTIPRGDRILSDPVRLPVRPSQHLAISTYVPDASGPATQHPLAMSDNYISAAGDHAAESGGAYGTTINCWLFADAVDVTPTGSVAGTVVTMGDSITDGHSSTPNADRRWPDYLARRMTDRHGRILAIANGGISGNEVLVDRVPVKYGPSALHRLRRDVLEVPNLRAVILLEGINDIGAGHAAANAIIAGDKKIIARLHAHGVRVFGGTLTAFGGSNATYGGDYGTAWGEQQRQAVNHWIRTGGAFDGVIDFDRAIADPTDPQRMAPDFDSGDHLHPGDAGYARMASVVPIDALFGRTTR